MIIESIDQCGVVNIVFRNNFIGLRKCGLAPNNTTCTKNTNRSLGKLFQESARSYDFNIKSNYYNTGTLLGIEE